jgi:DNA invertase Pin-like site-specific DNA recombinase
VRRQSFHPAVLRQQCARVAHIQRGLAALDCGEDRLQREMISARTKATLAAAKARGTKLGNPHGASNLRGHDYYKIGCEAQKVAADARAKDLAEIFSDLEREGITSANGEAAALNGRGIITARGGKWTARAVLNVKARL